MKYPNCDMYETLYARYLQPDSIDQFVDVAGEDFRGKRVLDLCCGTGVVSERALKKNAKQVVMVDQEKEMVRPEMLEHGDKILFIGKSVSEALRDLNRFYPQKFNIVFCRQAVNYWFTDLNASNICGVMRNNGVFIFNTFNTCPPDYPMVKEYEFENEKYAEVSYAMPDGQIHHVQVRQGYPPHTTTFDWFPPEYFEEVLKAYFSIERITNGRTDIYKCTKIYKRKMKWSMKK